MVIYFINLNLTNLLQDLYNYCNINKTKLTLEKPHNTLPLLSLKMHITVACKQGLYWDLTQFLLRACIKQSKLWDNACHSHTRSQKRACSQAKVHGQVFWSLVLNSSVIVFDLHEYSTLGTFHCRLEIKNIKLLYLYHCDCLLKGQSKKITGLKLQIHTTLLKNTYMLLTLSLVNLMSKGLDKLNSTQLGSRSSINR